MREVRWLALCLSICVFLIASQSYAPVNAQSRTLYGYVYSMASGKPIEATVVVNQCSNEQSATTDANGLWAIQYPEGTLGTITFSAPGYATESFQLDMSAQWYYAGGVISLQPI